MCECETPLIAEKDGNHCDLCGKALDIDGNETHCMAWSRAMKTPEGQRLHDKEQKTRLTPGPK